MNRPPVTRTVAKETTRFVFTPTGPAHIGHAYVAYVNRVIAGWEGGVYGYRIEDTLALVSAPELRQPLADSPYAGNGEIAAATGIPASQLQVAHYWGYENVKDMCAVGLGPLNYETKWQSQSDITNWYWRYFDFDKRMGEWPGPLISEKKGYEWGAMLTTFAVHPYIALNRVVEDIDMRCTTVLRGEGLKGEMAMYMMWAWMVADYRKELIPAMDYIPELRWSTNNDEGHLAYLEADTLSSSQPESHLNMTVKDVLAAGISGAKLIHYLETIYFYGSVGATPEGETAIRARPGAPIDPSRYVVEAPIAIALALPMNPYPILHMEDWERFMATGEVEG